MAGQLEPPGWLVFGPFEVDAPACELRKRGIRIKLSGQPFQILLALLANPGHLVTREQLRETLWSEGTFVDFEGSLNAAVAKLRRALNDSPDNPRYVETVPGLGYRFIGNLERPSAVKEPVDTEPLVTHPPTIARSWIWPAAVLVCLIAFAIGWRFHSLPVVPPPWELTRLTTDPGLSNTPALSPDRKLVAYSSDLGGAGRDLYVKQVSGGEPIRLTSDGTGNTSPDFTPDGTKIVFRSNRDGGGIYEIPTFGGEVRLIARDGLNPKVSPDGSRVAYWIGEDNVAYAVPGSGSVWVVSIDGGQPRRIAANFAAARYPIWSPDSKRLLFMGYTSGKAYDTSALDWWIGSIDGTAAVRTDAYAALAGAGLQRRERAVSPSLTYGIAKACCWLAAGNHVIFSTEGGDTSSLWQIGISPETGKISGEFSRLTAGAGNEVEPSCASAGAIVFTNLEIRRDVWSLPFDLNRGAPKGSLERITNGPAGRDHSSISSSERYLAFASSQTGRLSIWLHERATGKESQLASSSFVQRFPVISPSGNRVAFSSYENGKRLVYVSAPGGVPEKICEACFRATDWSRDEKTLLIFAGGPYQVNLLDIASRQQTELLKHPTHNLLYARFSPDERWVSFTARVKPNLAKIMIAPINGYKPIPQDAWITIADEQAEDWANWSPDGKTLYFTSARDGHFCLWGQRLDPKSHKPVGQAFAVQHLHGRLVYRQGGWSAASSGIAMVLLEDTGNVWMMSRWPIH